MSRTLERADEIEQRMIADASAAYDPPVSRVIRRHKATLRRIAELTQEGKTGQARTLARTSGMLDDLAGAIASAGHEAAGVIRRGLEEIKAVMADDDS